MPHSHMFLMFQFKNKELSLHWYYIDNSCFSYHFLLNSSPWWDEGGWHRWFIVYNWSNILQVVVIHNPNLIINATSFWDRWSMIEHFSKRFCFYDKNIFMLIQIAHTVYHRCLQNNVEGLRDKDETTNIMNLVWWFLFSLKNIYQSYSDSRRAEAICRG